MNELKLKHSEWRKIAKKLRRKRIRTLRAKQRDEKYESELKILTANPAYQKWVGEQKAIEQYEKEEQERQRAEAQEKWLQKEKEAQEDWKLMQSTIERQREEKLQRDMLIQETLDEVQKLRELDLKRKLEEEKERQKQHVELISVIDAFINGTISKLPPEFFAKIESRPGFDECEFFRKTGACRFEHACSRNHCRPRVSNILIIKHFYSHFSLNKQGEYDTDVGLEFGDAEMEAHFKEFFDDIVPELTNHGSVCHIIVCKNKSSHLRGNVYVEYRRLRDALRAYKNLQGRFYGGKQLNVEFTYVKQWRKAVCGLVFTQQCPKGSMCNFLHPIKSPIYFPFLKKRNGQYSHSPIESTVGSESTRSSYRADSSETRRSTSRRSDGPSCSYAWSDEERDASHDSFKRENKEPRHRTSRSHKKMRSRSRSRSSHSKSSNASYRRSHNSYRRRSRSRSR